ncbi:MULTISPECIES: hypothetical protein [Rhizobium]|uniref:hypothetical protein n=1 Tax=Rhizobium phaseoli TaxID=396 RepID=UPI0017C0E6AA|nr:hypothetical protein [Rhizobium phaseoli]
MPRGKSVRSEDPSHSRTRPGNQCHPRAGIGSEAAARTYGLTDAEILETIAHVAVNILTNSVNNTVGTILDFPKVERVA